jgi:tRNA A37 methylthiotransferase MiaB
MVALACPTLRIRYSTSHPKDMTDKVLEVMAQYDEHLQVHPPALCKAAAARC